MISLSPREKFTIVRGLGDHTDATTYYVRAVIRNSRTDELIATVDLDDSGDGLRFIKQWQVPADPSGQGFYIDITTSIYTDSGYTTKTTKYYDEYDTYLIAERMNPNLGFGGGTDVDYKKIQRMITEAVSGIPKAEKVSIPKIDLTTVLDAISDVQHAISSIDIPKAESIDFRPIITKLDQIISVVSDKEISEDHSQRFDSIKEEMATMFDRHGNESLKLELVDLIKKVDSALVNIRKFFTADVNDIKAGISEIKKEFDGINVVIMNKKGDLK